MNKNIFDIEDDLTLDSEIQDVHENYALYIDFQYVDKDSLALFEKLYYILDSEDIIYAYVKNSDKTDCGNLFMDKFFSSIKSAVKFIEIVNVITERQYCIWNKKGEFVDTEECCMDSTFISMLSGNLYGDFYHMLKREINRQYNNREKHLDLRNIDVSEQTVIEFSSIIEDWIEAEYFTSIDITGWDTSNLKILSFAYLPEVTRIIGIEDIDTSSLITMDNMFYDCGQLKKLDLNKWNTSKVKTMNYTFSGCGSLRELHINNWDTSNVTTMNDTFYMCGVEELDLSGWKTNKVRTLNYTFYKCKNLKKIDLTGWNTSRVRKLRQTFSESQKLTEVKGLSDFDMSNVTEAFMTFYSCGLFATNIVDTRKWVMNPECNLEDMFRYCKYKPVLKIKR